MATVAQRTHIKVYTYKIVHIYLISNVFHSYYITLHTYIVMAVILVTAVIGQYVWKLARTIFTIAPHFNQSHFRQVTNRSETKI